MRRLIPLLLLFAFSSVTSGAGETLPPGRAHRDAILAAVNAEIVRARPCGVEPASPSGYSIDHLAMEDEWACIAGTARYLCPPGPFAVEFIALLKWKCGCWKVASISLDAENVTRNRFLGLRRVPPAILPRWIRWSP